MILVTASEMQEMDRRTIDSFGIPGRILMENAGRGATRVLREHFADLEQGPVAIVCGAGNNGGGEYAD